MIGSVFIVISLLASLYSFYQYYKNFKGEDTLQRARVGYHIMTISVIGASVVLLYLIISHQFQYHYVYNYSSSNLSFGLLLSTFFAGQEGSFLLWALFSVFIGVVILSRHEKNNESESAFMLGFIPTVTFILVMVSPMLKNPFALVGDLPAYIDTKYLNSSLLNSSFLQNFILSDANSQRNVVKFGTDLLNVLGVNGIPVNQLIVQGKGLNPMLENFWMQIHPPVLFLGFALAAVPFGYAVSSLIKNEYKSWINKALPWVIATTLILGLGIMIGGYWAYGVLGWGGYWAWDPVENSSLVPWIISAALIHTMIIQKKSQAGENPGGFVKTNLLLAGIAFVLVVYSTFLTRSGILSETSVHSFTDPGALVYNVLIGFLILFTVGISGLIYFRRKEIETPAKSGHKYFSREIGLFYGAMLLVASAFAVIVGTSAPMFGQIVETDFYTQMNLPLVILMSLLIPLSLYLNWRSNDTQQFVKRALISALVSIAVTLSIIVLSGINEMLFVFLLFSSVFTIAANVEFILRSKNFKLMGGHITHIGFGIFLIGVLISAIFSFTEEIQLEKGEVYSFAGKTLSFNGYSPIENGRKYAFDINIKDKSEYKSAEPVMYISDYNNSLMREPYILTGLTKDIYIEPLSFEPGNSSNRETVSLKKGEPYRIGEATLTFEKFDLPEDAMQKMMNGEPFDVHAVINIERGEYTNKLDVVLVKGVSKKIFDEETDISFDVVDYNVGGILQITMNSSFQNAALTNDVLTVSISEKPFISLVWIGVLVMALGLVIVYIRRNSEVS